MVRANLTPRRQFVVGTAMVAAALATVVAGVWLSASGNPRLNAPSGRAALGAAPVAVVDAARAAGVRALPAPDAVLLALVAPEPSTADAVASDPPGGGLAAQPPAQPPPPSPPPGADDPLETVEEPAGEVDEVVAAVDETVRDTKESVEELDAVSELLADEPGGTLVTP